MAKIVLKTFDEVNAGRKKVRIIASLLMIPFLIVIGFLGFKVVEMYTTTQGAIDSFNLSQKKETTEAEKASELKKADELTEKMETGIFVDRWVVLYNRGTVLTASGEYEQGIQNLQQAVNEISAEDPNVCLIYANLAIANERYGDEFAADENTEDADYWYNQALLVTQNAPAICASPESDEDGEGSSEQGGESLQNTEERVQEKKDSLESGSDNQPTEGEDGEEPQETKPDTGDVEEIREQMDTSEQDKMESGNQTGNSGGESENYDKPW